MIVKNEIGEIASNAVSFTIGSKPVIDVQPESQAVLNGETVTFTVKATDATAYQWQIDRNDGNGFQDQAPSSIWQGTTSDTMSFPATGVRAAFQYRVIVKNQCGEEASAAVSFKLNIAVDNVIYEAITSDTCRVVSYMSHDASLTVQNVVNGMTVIEIGEEAFMDNSDLTSITLPDSIIIIRARAFKNCINLREMK